MTAINKGAINKDWTSKPTAKLDTVGLVSKIFAAECKEHVLQIVTE